MRAVLTRGALVAALLASMGAQRPGLDPHRGAAGDQAALRIVQVNDLTLAYRLEGRGCPVVFVHGEGLSHEIWERQSPALAHRYAALSYDRRGHGQSDAPPTGYSPAEHAQDLSGLLGRLGIARAHFVVHSRGGAIIMELLRRRPEVVRSLIFADATIALIPLSPVFEATVRGYRAPPPSLAEALAQREGRKAAPFYQVARERPEVAAVLSRAIDQVSPRVAMNPGRARDHASSIDIGLWGAEVPNPATLGKPVLIFVGERSDSFFQSGARAAERDWHARVHVIAGADHLLMLEAPDEFNRIALEFLAGVDAQPGIGPCV